MLLDVDVFNLVHALLQDELCNIVVPVDLFDLTVFVSEVALAAVSTHFGRKERFTVLVASAGNFFGFESGSVGAELVVGVCKLARLSVAAGVVLDDVLAEFSLVLGGSCLSNGKI